MLQATPTVPPHEAPGVGPTRRTVLAAALVLVTAAACSDSSPPPPTGRPGEVPRNDPDRPTVDAVVAEKLALLREYDAALVVRPEMTKELGPLRAAHQAHLDALGQPPIDATPSPSPTVFPATRAAILRRLAAAEKDAAGKRVTQCRALRSGAVARLVAAIGGAEAAHAARLRDLGGGE